MRDIRTMNMATGQQIESLEVMQRLGTLEYRNEGSHARISLIDEGTAVITSGFRVAPSTGMIVTVPTGTLYQRQIDVTGVVQTVAQNITLAVASGSPRIDTIQGQIVSVADKTDYAQIGTVASGGGSVVITNTAISRDIKYYFIGTSPYKHYNRDTCGGWGIDRDRFYCGNSRFELCVPDKYQRRGRRKLDANRLPWRNSSSDYKD